MGALNAVAVALTIAVAAPARAESVADWRPMIAEASARFGVPIAWIERVMQAESAGRTTLAGQPITSRAGAIGLMQVMPATWAELRARYGLGDDPYDPHDNILAGAGYLRMLYDRFSYPGLFAAYNAGPGRYADYLGGRALPNETRAYLVAVAGTARAGAPRAAMNGIDRLFVAIGHPLPAPSATEPMPSPDALFAIRPR